MKHCYIILIICLVACKQKNNLNDKTPGRPNVSVNNVQELRDTVKKEPVASYLIPMGNPKLERKFGVEIFETPYTFKYLLQMQYDGMLQADTLKLPNFGNRPTVIIKQGKEKMSCVIGFLDEENKFREYKLLSAKNDQLKLTVLRSYAVSSYK